MDQVERPAARGAGGSVSHGGYLFSRAARAARVAPVGSGVFGRCKALLWASFRRAFANVFRMSVAVLWVYFQFGSSMLITMSRFSVTWRGSAAQWAHKMCARCGAVQSTRSEED